MAKKDNVFYFSVRDSNNLRSDVWRCFTEKEGTEHDIYLLPLGLNSAIKTSFHKSGIWRTAFTNDYLSKKKNEGYSFEGDRIFDKWEEAKEIGKGIILALRVYVLDEAVTIPISTQGKQRNIVYVSPVEDYGFCNVFMILIMNYSVQEIRENWPGKKDKSQLIGVCKMSNGQSLCIVCIKDKTIYPPAPEEKLNFKLLTNKENIINQLPKQFRMGIGGNLEDGSRYIIEKVVNLSNG